MKTILSIIFLIFSLNTLAANSVSIGVKGMVCSFCAQGIEKSLKKHNEIEKVTVNMDKKTVNIQFKTNQQLSNKEISNILKEAGYEATFENQNGQ